MDANEAMDAVFTPYLRLFKRHPVVMHLVELAALGVLLYAAWRIGGRGLLIAELVILVEAESFCCPS